VAHLYAVQVVREDGTEVRQVPIQVDWEPAREFVRLQALARGQSVESAFLLECAFHPVWHPERGQPFVGGVEIIAAAPAIQATVSVDYFADAARAVAKRLVSEAILRKGDLVRCFPVAFADPAADPPMPRRSRPIPPRIPLREGALAELAARDALCGTSDAELPVFVPRLVLDQATEQTEREPGRETGGILIGNLCRDRETAGLFLEVTAQIPARHTEATSASLTFTPETWTDVQAALTLRGQEEIMLGWWHSHPVREWCRECPPEKRADCTLARGFLSEDDRLLHRTVFPRAYSVALVVNDLESGPTFSLFGWSRGLIAHREFPARAEVEHAGQ
jgi:proteasome lid subunit RPN8/RPN11